MPLFLVELVNNDVRQVLRARCKACARNVAVNNAGAEGTAVWRDPEQSTVKLIEPDRGIDGIVLRLDAPAKTERVSPLP